MVWFVYALCTSVCWGLGYAMSEKLLHNNVSPSVLLIIIYVFSLPVYVFLGMNNGTVASSLKAIGEDTGLLTVAAIMVLAFIAGNLFIMMSVQMKNATYANLIEITYPVFTILFTYLFFKQFHMNVSTMIGGALIISGVAMLVYKG